MSGAADGSNEVRAADLWDNLVVTSCVTLTGAGQ